MTTDYFGKTDKGNVRSKNEDCFILKEIGDFSYLLAICVDGIGGHAGGDVAANLACDCILEQLSHFINPENSLESLHDAVVSANNHICSQHYIPVLAHMGCVLTTALINLETGKMDVCHVGDTRLYVFKNGVLTKLTSDHSLIGPKEEEGKLSELEAMRHPDRNIVTRSIGKQILDFGTKYIQTHTVHLESCQLLLCSDGLYDMIDSSQITKILSDPIPTNKRVKGLIDAALNAGGHDNITAIVIDINN